MFFVGKIRSYIARLGIGFWWVALLIDVCFIPEEIHA